MTQTLKRYANMEVLLELGDREYENKQKVNTRDHEILSIGRDLDAEEKET